MRSLSKPFVLAAIAAALLATGCTDAEDAGQPGAEGAGCCDCACSDGADVCLNTIVDRELGETCDVVCAAECAAHADCPTTAEATSCQVAPDGKNDNPCVDGGEDCTPQQEPPNDPPQP